MTLVATESVSTHAKGGGFYVPWLDGLRALAALAVLFSHSTAFPGPLGSVLQPFAGTFGVYLFLVLSAFLLSRLLLLEQRREGHIGLWAFWVRRSLRIWPLYVAFGIFSIAYALVTGARPLSEIIGLALAHFTFIEDVTMARWGWGASLPFSQHLWTISLEEHVYLLLPILLSVYFVRENRRTLQATLIAIATIAVAARLALFLLGAEHTLFWASPLHPEGFLAGVYLGVCTQAASRSSGAPRNRAAVWLAAAAAALAALMVAGTPVLFPPAEVYGYPGFAFAAAALIIGISGIPTLARALAIRPLRYLGMISYGIYVFHLLALQLGAYLLKSLGGMTPVTHLAVSALITIIAADLSYRILERPFLALKARFTTIPSRPI